MLILNEEKYATDLINGKNKDIKSLKKKVNLITRYNYHIKHMSNDENYENTVWWLMKHHENFYECNYSKFIATSIKNARKFPFYKIDSLRITQSELNILQSLENIRQQKILFILLCLAKFQRDVYGYTNGFVNFSIVDVYHMAHVSVPAEDREYLLYAMLQQGLLKAPQKNDSAGLFVCFISENEDESVILIDENNCKELAYVYLSFIHNGIGYLQCQRCGCIIKKYKNVKYCKDCAEDIHREQARDSYTSIGSKILACIDCGIEFEVSAKDTHTIRCKECQHIKQLEYQRNSMAKKRQTEM